MSLNLGDAVDFCDQARCEELVRGGAEVDEEYSGDQGVTPLMAASDHGHLPTVKLLCDHGADVNRRDVYGDTALMYAAQEGNTAVVEELLKRGARVNDVSDNGWSALMRASAYHGGHLATVQCLLKHGADINIRDKKGRSALSLATDEGNTEVKEFLQSKSL